MKSAKSRKLQYLLITELLDKGSVELLLPDGITLEIGIVQEDQMGNLSKTDDYCYVVATRSGKSTLLDSYNLGLQYEPEKDTIVFEDEIIEPDGKLVKTLDIV
jgi:hypothetical protein